MEKIALKKLRQDTKFAQKAAKWFSEKWDIPQQEYENSIQQCIYQRNTIPQWYVVVNESDEIIAGAGKSRKLKIIFDHRYPLLRIHGKLDQPLPRDVRPPKSLLQIIRRLLLLRTTYLKQMA